MNRKRLIFGSALIFITVFSFATAFCRGEDFQIPLAVVYEGQEPLGPVEIPINFKGWLEQLGSDTAFALDPQNTSLEIKGVGDAPCYLRVLPDSGRKPTSQGVLVFNAPASMKRLSGILHFSTWKNDSIVKTPVVCSGIKFTDNKIQTKYYVAELNDHGELVSLKNSRQKLSLLSGLKWTLNHHTDGKTKIQNRGKDVTSFSQRNHLPDSRVSREWSENGLCLAVQRFWEVARDTYITQTIRFYETHLEVEYSYRPFRSGMKVTLSAEAKMFRAVNLCGPSSLPIVSRDKETVLSFPCFYAGGKDASGIILDAQSSSILSRPPVSSAIIEDEEEINSTLSREPDGHYSVKLEAEYYGAGDQYPLRLRVRLYPVVNAKNPEVLIKRARNRRSVVFGAPSRKDSDATDLDRDGLTDLEELEKGTNPRHPDTDFDGLADGEDQDPLRNAKLEIYEEDIDTDNDGISNLKEYAAQTNPYDKDTDGDGMSDAEDAEPLVAVGASEFTQNEIRPINDIPTLCINGKPLIGQFGFLDTHNDIGIMQRVARTGVPVVFLRLVFSNPEGAFPYGKDLEFKLNALYGRIEEMVKKLPGTSLMIRITLMPRPDFAREHPEGLFRGADGSSMMAHPYWGDIERYSSCSREWKAAYGGVLVRLINRLRNAPWRERVIGFQFAGMRSGEWWFWDDFDLEGRGSDAGPAAIRALRKHTLKKYKGDVTLLRKAWKDGSIDFATLLPNHPQIHQANSFHGTGPGGIADPYFGMPEIDMEQALRSELAEAANYFSAIIHKASSGRLIAGNFLSYSDATTPDLDYISTPAGYNSRRPGRCRAFGYYSASLLRAGKLLLVEDDLRTYKGAGNWLPQENPHTLPETLEVMKREYGRHFALNDIGYQVQFQPDWYDDPDILKLMSQQCLAAEIIKNLPRKSVARIGLVDDPRQEYINYLQKPYTNEYETLATGFATEPLYLNDALKNPDPYRVLVFGAVPALDNTQRKVLKESVATDNRTLVFMMGAGIINPDNSDPMSLKNLESMTGFSFIFRGGECRKEKITITKQGATLLNAKEGDDFYGGFAYEVHRHYPLVTSPFAVVPDRNTVVVGRFPDGSAAIAIKKHSDWISVYVGASHLSPEFIAALARQQKIHSYCEAGQYVFANESVISFHSSTAGTHRINLPKQSDVYDIFSQKWVAESAGNITVKTGVGETRVFVLAEKTVLTPLIQKAKEQLVAFQHEITRKQARLKAPGK